MLLARTAVVSGTFLLLMASCYQQKELAVPKKKAITSEQRNDPPVVISVINSYNPNAKGVSRSNVLPLSGWTISSIAHETRVLINFSLQKIPQRTIIKSAKLFLYAETNYVLNPDWGGGHTQPDGNSNAWIMQRATTTWDTAVTWLKQPTTDALNQISFPKTISFDQDYVIDVTKLVQEGVNNPSGYHGWALRLLDPRPYRCVAFHGNYSATVSKHPRLEIDY